MRRRASTPSRRLRRRAAPPPTDAGWTKIADEGQAFTVSGTQTVRYGHAPYWITATVTNEGSCTNAFFATDPIVGTVKQCEVLASAGSPPAAWTRIAGEGQVVQRRRRADGALRQRLCVGDPDRRRLRRVHELVLRERSAVRRRQAVRSRGFVDGAAVRPGGRRSPPKASCSTWPEPRPFATARAPRGSREA